MKLAIISVLVTISMVRGQLTKIGKCPDAKMMTGFEMPMLSGLWYVTMKNGDFADLFVKCMRLDFTLVDPKNFEVEGTGLDMAGNKYTNTGTVTYNDAKKNLRILVPSIAFDDVFKVIHVNSRSISIGYNCVQTGEFHSEYVWIFSRSVRISDGTADAIRNFVQRRGIDASKLNIVTKGCPITS